jgi:hypothetical protein
MTSSLLKATLNRLRERGVIPCGTEERNYLLRSLGFKQVMSFHDYTNHFFMLIINDIPVYPFQVRVRYADPYIGVVQAEVYYEPLETCVEYWLDVDTIVEAGLAPVIHACGNGQAMDMAFMCKEQEQSFRESLFAQAVIEDGERLYPEASFHIQYVLEVLYGVRDFEQDGKLTRIATDIAMAESWRRAIMAEGKSKSKKVMQGRRYAAFLSALEDLEDKHVVPVTVEKKEQNDSIINKLMSKL